MPERKFFEQAAYMRNETEYIQRLQLQPEESVGEKNVHLPGEEQPSTDYMQLYAAAQWLRFPRKIEAEFIADYYNSTIKTTRWAFTAGFLIYALFGYLDLYVAPISLRNVWLIRFGIGCPVLLIVVFFTFIKRFAPYMQLLGAAAATIGGVGVVAIIMITQPVEVANTHYYSGLILVMLFTSSWLRFWYALVTNTIVIISYQLVAIYEQNLLGSLEGNVQFLSNNFVLLATYIIGAFANYSLERHTRIDFLQKRTIEAEKNKVNSQRVAIQHRRMNYPKS
jgi:hypothetical protein